MSNKPQSIGKLKSKYARNNYNMIKIKLDELDWLILSALHLNARTSVSELAQQFSLREHKVRYRVQRLKDAEIIRAHPLVDTYRLGLVQHDVFLSLASPSANGVVELQQFLINSQQVPWVGTFAGEYQCGFTVCTKTTAELRVFLDSLSRLFGEIIFRKAIAYRESYAEYSLLAPEAGAERRSLGFGVVGAARLDQLNHRLLLEITKHPDSSLRDLAGKIGISAPAVQQRLRGLEEQGVLLGFNSIVNFTKLQLTAFTLLLELKSASANVRQRLANYAAGKKEIHYIVESVGAFDGKLGVLVREPEQVNEVIQEIHQLFYRELAAVHTLTAFRYLKVERYPFRENKALA